MRQDDMSFAVVTKSDQLNAEDLIPGPIVGKVLSWKRVSDQKQPLLIFIDTWKQPFKPCLTMRKVIVDNWGRYGDEWIGRSMKLYMDPNVQWGGKDAGGVRISELSHIDGPHSTLVTKSRGRREYYEVLPLAVEKSFDVDAFFENASASIKGAESMEALRSVFGDAYPVLSEHKEVQSMLKQVYDKKKAELESGNYEQPGEEFPLNIEGE